MTRGQLSAHLRISLLLVPTAEVVDGEDVVSFYWLDRRESGAADTVVRGADCVGQNPQEAAGSIIRGLSLQS